MAKDLQAFVDCMAGLTCVVSVEKREDGYGAIRIVTGNKAYIDSIENPPEGMAMLTQEFVPNSEYTRYLTRDLNFEDYCYRSAVGKKCLHSYAHPDRLDLWFSMTFMPLDADDGDVCYCTYTMEVSFEPSSERLSNVSSAQAADVLEIAVKLRSSNDFNRAMEDAIADIRESCHSEYACIMLMNEDERSCEVLGESFDGWTALKPMKTYAADGFYDIAESWEDTIAGSNCLVVKNKNDMKVVAERNPVWYRSLVDAAVESIVLFPLKSHDELLGYIWAVGFDPDRSGKIKEYLELTTYVLAAEIDNHLLLGRLKVLGSRDMLTGVMNRNEMNNRVDAISRGDVRANLPIGIVFADLNGLKGVNDKQGHAAGDKLLKDGAAALEQVFAPESIFRAGGDEFVAIVEGVAEGELQRMVEAVRQASARYDRVSFALGYGIAERRDDVRAALRVADERMYADKDAYYGRTAR